MLLVHSEIYYVPVDDGWRQTVKCPCAVNVADCYEINPMKITKWANFKDSNLQLSHSLPHIFLIAERVGHMDKIDGTSPLYWYFSVVGDITV